MLTQACAHHFNRFGRTLFFIFLFIAAEGGAIKVSCWFTAYWHGQRFVALFSIRLPSPTSFNPHSYPSAL